MPKNKEEEIVAFLQSFETFYEILFLGFAFNLDLSPFSPTATKVGTAISARFINLILSQRHFTKFFSDFVKFIFVDIFKFSILLLKKFSFFESIGKSPFFTSFTIKLKTFFYP
jgi:hypothetical protein